MNITINNYETLFYSLQDYTATVTYREDGLTTISVEGGITYEDDIGYLIIEGEIFRGNSFVPPGMPLNATIIQIQTSKVFNVGANITITPLFHKYQFYDDNYINGFTQSYIINFDLAQKPIILDLSETNIWSIGGFANDYVDSPLITEVLLPDTLEEIRDYAFIYNPITSYGYPSMLHVIGYAAFAYCEIENVILTERIFYIGDDAFRSNKITNLTISTNRLNSIPFGSFADNLLEELTIPYGVTSIVRGAFEGNNLTRITIPDTVASIESWAFDWNPGGYVYANLLEGDTASPLKLRGYTFPTEWKLGGQEEWRPQSKYEDISITEESLPDPNLLIGESRTTEGQIGRKRIDYEELFIDDITQNEIRNEVETIVTPMVTRKVYYGTKYHEPVNNKITINAVVKNVSNSFQIESEDFKKYSPAFLNSINFLEFDPYRFHKKDNETWNMDGENTFVLGDLFKDDELAYKPETFENTTQFTLSNYEDMAKSIFNNDLFSIEYQPYTTDKNKILINITDDKVLNFTPTAINFDETNNLIISSFAEKIDDKKYTLEGTEILLSKGLLDNFDSIGTGQVIAADNKDDFTFNMPQTLSYNIAIPIETLEQDDPELQRGQTRTEEGTIGEKDVNITVNTHRFERYGDIVGREEIIITPMKPKIIFNGTGPIITWITETKIENIEILDEELEDPDLDFGLTRTEPGETGQRKITLERKFLDDVPTNETRIITTEIIKPMVTRKLYTGTRPIITWEEETTTQPIPIETIYLDDPNALRGETRTVEGTAGSKVVTTRTKYINGVESETEILSEKVLTPMTPRYIYTGTKVIVTWVQKQRENDIAITTEIKDDPDRDVGDIEIINGTKGTTLTTWEQKQENGVDVTGEGSVRNSLTRTIKEMVPAIKYRGIASWEDQSRIEIVPFVTEIIHPEPDMPAEFLALTNLDEPVSYREGENGVVTIAWEQKYLVTLNEDDEPTNDPKIPTNETRNEIKSVTTPMKTHQFVQGIVETPIDQWPVKRLKHLRIRQMVDDTPKFYRIKLSSSIIEAAWSDISGKPAQATRWPTWSEVTSKPSTFAPSSHTHAWSEVTSKPTTATRWPAWSEVTSRPSDNQFPNTAQALGASQNLNNYTTPGFYYQSANANASTSLNYPVAQAGTLIVTKDAGTTQMYYHYNGSGIFYRTLYGSAWTAWQNVLTPTWANVLSKPAQATRWPTWSEVTSKPTTFAPSSHTHTWAQVTGKPSTFTSVTSLYSGTLAGSSSATMSSMSGYVFLIVVMNTGTSSSNNRDIMIIPVTNISYSTAGSSYSRISFGANLRYINFSFGSATNIRTGNASEIWIKTIYGVK